MIHPLARDVAFWLAVKVVALAALFFLFFGPAHRPSITPERVESRLLAPAGEGAAADVAAPGTEDPASHD